MRIRSPGLERGLPTPDSHVPYRPARNLTRQPTFLRFDGLRSPRHHRSRARPFPAAGVAGGLAGDRAAAGDGDDPAVAAATRAVRPRRAPVAVREGWRNVAPAGAGA